jgi:hypothetical protein
MTVASIEQLVKERYRDLFEIVEPREQIPLDQADVVEYCGPEGCC